MPTPHRVRDVMRVTIGGALADTSTIPALVRVARSVEGVVDVDVSLDHPRGADSPPQFNALY